MTLSYWLDERVEDLIQLNEHLDEIHSDFDPTTSVKAWFKKTQQHFKKITREISNDPIEEESIITSHWTRNDTCYFETCSKPLGLIHGRLNCRKCGHEFCHFHTNFYMKLSQKAIHDPENGSWQPVCQLCYMSREGYLDIQGASRGRMHRFRQLRKKRLEMILLEANKIFGRLEKFITMYQTLKEKPGFFSNEQKDMDQSIVVWEPDSSRTKCPICRLDFTLWFNPRHHCRLCGRVVCGSCLKALDLYPSGVFPVQEESVMVQLKVCVECHGLLAKRIQFDQPNPLLDALVVLNEEFVQERKVVEVHFPMFNSAVSKLRSKEILHMEDSDYLSAMKQRKYLLDSFAILDTISKKAQKLPFQTFGGKMIQKHFCQAIHLYLQTYMCTLQLLPPATSKSEKLKMFKKAQEQLQVLEQQRLQVNALLMEAQELRQLENMATLQENVRDIEKELELVIQNIEHFSQQF